MVLYSEVMQLLKWQYCVFRGVDNILILNLLIIRRKIKLFNRGVQISFEFAPYIIKKLGNKRTTEMRLHPRSPFLACYSAVSA